ncbi:hypothetical protein P7C73_g6547, partial [Tremellales sp. Uapishka_1]
MLAFFLALPFMLPALAAITPTSPDASTVVKVGDSIDALWTADTTGTWTDVEIQLMTGDNYQMVALETLASGLDGTSTTTFSAVAPDVSPYSKIYFLQFTEGGNVSTATWTTRFTIAGADGSTTDPTNSTVYPSSTTPVQWGTGVLVSNSTSDASASSSSSAVASSSTSASTSTSSASSMTSTAVVDAASSSSSTAPASSASASTSSSASAVAASSSSVKSSAGRIEIGLGMVILGALASLLV